MKYKKYPTYKDNGVDWLGEIPSEWINTKLKYHSFIYNGNSISDNEKENYENLNTNFSIPYISTKDIDSNFLSIDYDNGMRISVNNDKFRRAKKGSSLICIEGGSAGKKLGLLEKDVCFVNKLACIDSYNNLDNKFCNYILRSSVFNYLFSLSTTGLIPGVSINQLKDFEIILPPLNEQQQIANYLDEKTSKIDNLIEKQTKQIELLKEKRQAVISHAVTKGINPNVPMKDSGVEWLGEIPEHWEVKKLKFVLQLLNKKEKIINQIVVALENIESWSGKYIESDSSYQGDDVAFCIGDILFGKLRPYLAKVFLCSFDGIAFGDLLAYRPIKDYASKYAFYSLISEDFIKIVDSSTYGTKMPRASSEFLSEMRLTVPPLKEQQQIANYLDEKTSKIDILIEKSNKSIELLKEKRTALISAAVTGKIDVREFE